MNINEVINFKNDLEKGHYISAIELIEIVESFNEGIKPKDLVSFLEALNIFTMRLHPFSEYEGSIDYGYPEVDEKIGRKIANFLYLRENRAKDERLHNLYINEIYKLENICWNRADLLRVEGFVNNTDIVKWGKKHVLQRMYSEMVEEQPKVFNALAENAQQAILKSLGLTQLDNNITRHAQQTQQQAQNKELHKKIAELENKLLKFKKTAYEDLDLPNYPLEDAQTRIAELENKLSQLQETKHKVTVIPFGKRIDFIDKNLPQSERIKKSYELYSDNVGFHEDKHPVNTPDEMIKRIQGLLKVIKRKDSKIAELEKRTSMPDEPHAEIDDLKEQLRKVNAELTAAKTATTAQPIDWQSISKDDRVYPPELHLALMIWQRIYLDNELKNNHLSHHSDKFKVIANRMNLDPTSTLGKRIAIIINTAYSKNQQASLADPLRAIEQLYMPASELEPSP